MLIALFTNICTYGTTLLEALDNIWNEMHTSPAKLHILSTITHNLLHIMTTFLIYPWSLATRVFFGLHGIISMGVYQFATRCSCRY